MFNSTLESDLVLINCTLTDYTNVRQISEVFIVVKAIADHKLVGNVEALIINFIFVIKVYLDHLPQQDACLQALRVML